MPQGPIAVRDVIDATGYVPNITGTAVSALKTTNAKVINVVVVAASTAVGGVWDCAAAASTAAGNKIFTIPATVGVYTLNWPCATGVTVATGAGMTLVVSLA